MKWKLRWKLCYANVSITKSKTGKLAPPIIFNCNCTPIGDKLICTNIIKKTLWYRKIQKTCHLLFSTQTTGRDFKEHKDQKAIQHSSCDHNVAVQ
jgi:hypothetical protein